MELRRFLPLYDFYCCSANEKNANYEKIIRLCVYFFFILRLVEFGIQNRLSRRRSRGMFWSMKALTLKHVEWLPTVTIC